MEPIFLKSLWEVDPSLPYTLDELLTRVQDDGFDGTELFVPAHAESVEDVVRTHKRRGLDIVAAITTTGATVAEHRTSLEVEVQKALSFEPLLINCHTGRDIFAFEDNLGVFELALELEERHGVPIRHETHRRRATFSAPATRRYLEALPDLRLTADVSHWMVVHESDLRDQWANVELLIQRSDHIHARVGFAEGPQVSDPSAPEYAEHWENHLSIWMAIADRVRSENGRLTITPEFGPPPYAPTLPFTGQPTVDVWKVNAAVRNRLERALLPSGSQ
jgi:hypothetical protein